VIGDWWRKGVVRGRKRTLRTEQNNPPFPACGRQAKSKPERVGHPRIFRSGSWHDDWFVIVRRIMGEERIE